MWPEPDPAIVRRMRAAHLHACRLLSVRPVPGHRHAWGWQGRTLGRPVTTQDRPAWLRLVTAPVGDIVATFWNGAIDAQRILPPSIPRPQLLRWHDWADRTWAYRAELHEPATAPTITDRTAAVTEPRLPDRWWEALRASLATIAVVPTDRISIHPGFLAWAMPRYLGISSDLDANHPWATAHGDLHYANLCAPEFQILDWEGWGLAPAGYDAAMLHCRSLLAPAAANRIRTELVHLLESPSGRFAELVVITELLDGAANGATPGLAEPLRRRAEAILGQPVPTSQGAG